MADYVFDTATTVGGWQSFDDLARSIGYTGIPYVQRGYIQRPTGGAVDVYIRTTLSGAKPSGTTPADLGAGLLTAGKDFSELNFPSTQLFIYTSAPTALLISANSNR